MTMDAQSRCQPSDNPSDSSQAALALEGQQVLLVEDCADQGRLYLKFLELAGADVTLECNGPSAIDAVRKSLTRFDAVVMDFKLPKKDGLESTKQLRSIDYRGTIIAATAYDPEGLRQSWFQAGCDEFLEKPLKREELIGAILRHTATAKDAVSCITHITHAAST